MSKRIAVRPSSETSMASARAWQLARRGLYVAGAIILLSLIAYTLVLWFSPPPPRSQVLAARSQEGPVASTKAISQLPNQRIAQPVVDTVDGLSVDIDSDNMRAISEINYRDGMEEQLQRIEDAYGDGQSLAQSTRSVTQPLEEK